MKVRPPSQSVTQTNFVPVPENLKPNFYSSYEDFYKNMTKHFNLDNPAPYVSARSWVMTDLDSGEILFAKREKEPR